MEGEQFIGNKKDGTEFREIVLQHLKRILEISSSELRQMKKVSLIAHGESVVYEEDTRESYIQAVEALAIVLLPYFDKEMMEEYDTCSEVMSSWNFELKEKLGNKFEEIRKKFSLGEIPSDYYSKIKVNHAKRLFRELNLLLKRQDYLKGSIFGERE
ncbi:hypothetical protein K8R30_02570 [archaeon]|nr:hypothetical protein [archaeon]